VFVRPEAEGGLALPHGTFGLDVLALAGQLRFVEQQSMREIHRSLRARAVDLAPRTVTGLAHRYAAMLVVSLAESTQPAHRLLLRDRLVLALDGVQPEAGRPVLWVLRDAISGRVFLARSLARAQAADLAAWVSEVAAAVRVPIEAVLCTGPLASSPPGGGIMAAGGAAGHRGL
jgi:hypothetical protein